MSDVSYPAFSFEGLDLSPGIFMPEADPIEEANPQKLAHALATRINNSKESIIQAGEIANFALRTFRPVSLERKEFFQALVESAFLSTAEARAEGQSPKISKLCAIGEEAAFLRREEIISLLSPGYSIMYEAVQLLREVRKRSSNPEEVVVDTLRGAAGDVNREFIVSARKALKRPMSNEDSEQEPRDISANNSTAAELLLLTPQKADTRRFAEDYANPDAMAGFRINHMVAKNAVALCIAEIRDYPTIAGRLLPLAGFKHIRKVYLLSRPNVSEITDAKIGIVASRTNGALPDGLMQPWEAGTTDDRTLALQIAPNAVSKLHAFATSTAPDWTCLAGHEVWSEMPSLKGMA